MLLRQMQYFVAVVNCNSFTEAAEQCYISQSAISQQIMSLEEELGIKLLIREKRKFSLTEAGEYFYHKSLILLEGMEQMKQETIRIGSGNQGTVRIGYLITCGIAELTATFSKFVEDHPDTRIHVERGNHEELFLMLQMGQLDIAVNDQRRAFSDAYVNYELGVANLFIEINRKNQLSALDKMIPEDLKKVPCVIVASKEQEDYERDYYRTILGLGDEVIFAQTIEEARLLVASNRGYLVVETESIELEDKEHVKHIPLMRHGKQMTKKYCAFWRKDNDRKELHHFADLLKEQFSL